MAINATAVWRVGPSGANTNGGGYDAGISGAATDYSQQNAAQASGTHGTASGTATFTDATAANFTSAMVGNCIQIVSGSGFTAGFYFVTAFTSSSIVTLDRSPGTGTVAVWHLGGRWADFWTNTTSSGPLVPGNIVYILGSGIPNPLSPDYTSPGNFTPATGNGTAGNISFIGDPNTPSGGVPCISTPGLLFYGGGYNTFENMYFIASSGSNGNLGLIYTGTALARNIVFDQNGYDITFSGNGPITCIGCEVFSSHVKRTTNAQYGINSATQGCILINCNFHDCIGPGVFLYYSAMEYCIVAKNGGVGVVITGNSSIPANCSNNTIDANIGNGIEFATQASLFAPVFNNIITNHITGGTYGMTVDVGTAAANNRVKQFVDYNVFYNNTTNYNAISAGAHDTALGTNPYVAQSTENYTLA